MSLRKRFALLTLLLTALMGLFISSIGRQTDRVSEARLDIRDDLDEIGVLLDIQETLTSLLRTASTEGTGSAPYARSVRALEAQLALLAETRLEDSASAAGKQQEREAEAMLLANLKGWRGLWDNPKPLTPAEELLRTQALYSNGSAAVRAFATGASEELDAALGELDRSERGIWWTAWRWTLVLSLVLLAAWLAFYRWIISPILKLRRAVRSIQKHRFDVVMPKSQAGEVGELTDAFSRMSREIQAFTGELEQRVQLRTRELHDSRERLRQMLDQLPDAVGVSTVDGILLQGNDRYIQLLAPDQRSRLMEVLACERSPQGYYRWMLPGGRGRLLEVLSHRLTPTEPGGEPVILEYYRDQTEQCEVEAALVTSQKLAAIGRLSSGIAHEVNNPLTAIGACAEGLLRRAERGAVDPEVQAEYLRTIRDEVFRCKEMTEKLLDFSRQREDRAEPTGVAEVVASTISLARPLADRRGVEIDCELDALDGEAHNSPRAIRQVLLNLLMNAIEASDPGGEISVSLEARGGELRMTVRDSGIGVPAEHLASLFEPFFTSTRSNTGTGLGLFVCQGIAQALGGLILAESAGAGRGAAFTLVLPRQGGAAEPATAHREAATHAAPA